MISSSIFILLQLFVYTSVLNTFEDIRYIFQYKA